MSQPVGPEKPSYFDNSQGQTVLHSSLEVNIASSHQIREGSEGAGLGTDSKTYIRMQTGKGVGGAKHFAQP